MKSFKQYLNEIRIARHKMPQVDSDHYDDLMKWLSAGGIMISRGSMDPKKLIPIQGISHRAVSSMTHRKPKEQLLKPIIISGDNHILDGHHRWGTGVKLDRKMPVIKIHLPVLKALEAIKKYPKTTFASPDHIVGAKYDKELAK